MKFNDCRDVEKKLNLYYYGDGSLYIEREFFYNFWIPQESNSLFLRSKKEQSSYCTLDDALRQGSVKWYNEKTRKNSVLLLVQNRRRLRDYSSIRAKLRVI